MRFNTQQLDWIAVTHKLPETDTPVKVVGLLNRQVPYVLDFLPGGEFTLTILYPEKITEDVSALVTHWLPLPQLPAEPVVTEDVSGAMELLADTLLPRFIPDDPAVDHLTFMLNAEGRKFEVMYEKGADGYWKFSSYKSLQ